MISCSIHRTSQYLPFVPLEKPEQLCKLRPSRRELRPDALLSVHSPCRQFPIGRMRLLALWVLDCTRADLVAISQPKPLAIFTPSTTFRIVTCQSQSVGNTFFPRLLPNAFCIPSRILSRGDVSPLYGPRRGESEPNTCPSECSKLHRLRCNREASIVRKRRSLWGAV